MAQHTADPVWFLIADLAAFGRGPSSLRAQLKQYNPFTKTPKDPSHEPSQPKHKLKTIDDLKRPKRSLSLYHFAPIKHWAVRVRNYCYEVNSVYDDTQQKKVFVLHNRMHYTEWEDQMVENQTSFEQIQVGATTLSTEAIVQQAQLVWTDHLKITYKLLSNNCQNFAHCLYKLIAVSPADMDDEARRILKRIPFRLTQFKTVLKRMAPMLMRGLMLEGLEMSVEVAALIGLEVIGLSLLGPVGEIILIVSILAPLFLLKSKDSKWVEKVKKKWRGNDNPALVGNQRDNIYVDQSDGDALTEYQMRQLLDDFSNDKTVRPIQEFAELASGQEMGVVAERDTRTQGHDAGLKALEYTSTRDLDQQLTINELLNGGMLDRPGTLMSTSTPTPVSKSTPKVFVVPRKPLPQNSMVDHVYTVPRKPVGLA